MPICFDLFNTRLKLSISLCLELLSAAHAFFIVAGFICFCFPLLKEEITGVDSDIEVVNIDGGMIRPALRSFGVLERLFFLEDIGSIFGVDLDPVVIHGLNLGLLMEIGIVEEQFPHVTS